MRERLTRLSFRLGPPLALGIVLGLAGPFGTYDLLPIPGRLAYWLAAVSTNWLLTDAILRRVEETFGEKLPAPPLATPLVAAFLAAVPATGVVTLANGLSGIGWPTDVPVLFGQVLLLLAAIAIPVHFWETMKARIRPGVETEPPLTARSTAPAPSATAAPNGLDGAALFTARLPRPSDGQLICLEMQDHYLVVHHTLGSDMILCRMEDAARELSALGRRVHRSWWVADAAVQGAERDGARVYLNLVDGRRVPVGRSYRPDLKAAGWL